jgi:NADPH:quinone reductase-like Zn-dependent oxidoreductase
LLWQTQIQKFYLNMHMKYVLMYTSRPDLAGETDPEAAQAIYKRVYEWFGENAGVMAEVMALAAERKIKPVEPSSRPLAEAPAVLRQLLDRQVVGKVCLVP